MCGGGRCDVLEDLEGVMRSAGLALRGAEIGLESPAIAAVGVAIAPQCSECGRGVAVAAPELEAAAVQNTRVGGHEVGSG
jgi:hypothetical protein